MGNNLPGNGEFLIYQIDDGQVKLDVRLENETIWLTQQMISELFQTTAPNISMHIKNIYNEGELQPEATVKECGRINFHNQVHRFGSKRSI